MTKVQKLIVNTKASDIIKDKALKFIDCWKKPLKFLVDYKEYNQQDLANLLKVIHLIYFINENKMVFITINENQYCLEQWEDDHNIANHFGDLEKIKFVCIGSWFEHKFKIKE